MQCRRWGFVLLPTVKSENIWVQQFELYFKWQLMEWHGMLYPKKKKFQRAPSERKVMVQLSGIRKMLFLCPFQSNTSELWPLHFSTNKSKCSPWWSSPHDESQNSCFSMPPDHTPVCMPLRPAQNFHGECFHIHPTVLTPHPHIFTFLVTKRHSARIPWQCTAECMFQWL